LTFLANVLHKQSKDGISLNFSLTFQYLRNKCHQNTRNNAPVIATLLLTPYPNYVSFDQNTILDYWLGSGLFKKHFNTFAKNTSLPALIHRSHEQVHDLIELLIFDIVDLEHDHCLPGGMQNIHALIPP
jgi:hypothetical protein